MYAESMRLEPRWAAEFRGFWDLPEDFDFDVDHADGDGAAGRARQAHAARSRWREFLAGSEVYLPEDEVDGPGRPPR